MIPCLSEELQLICTSLTSAPLLFLVTRWRVTQRSRRASSLLKVLHSVWGQLSHAVPRSRAWLYLCVFGGDDEGFCLQDDTKYASPFSLCRLLWNQHGQMGYEFLKRKHRLNITQCEITIKSIHKSIQADAQIWLQIHFRLYYFMDINCWHDCIIIRVRKKTELHKHEEKVPHTPPGDRLQWGK